jgi:hypothetical protein
MALLQQPSTLFIPMSLKRKCPHCGDELIYANLPGYKRAKQQNSLCRKCAASPAVIQRKLKEKEQQRVAEESTLTFMREFWNSIVASVSGSRER